MRGHQRLVRAVEEIEGPIGVRVGGGQAEPAVPGWPNGAVGEQRVVEREWPGEPFLDDRCQVLVEDAFEQQSGNDVAGWGGGHHFRAGWRDGRLLQVFGEDLLGCERP